MGFSAEAIEEYKATQAKRKNDNPDKDNLHETVKSLLRLEFPELWDCDKVHVRFLWTDASEVTRYRVNGWNKEKVTFSAYVQVWTDKKGVQYKIIC